MSSRKGLVMLQIIIIGAVLFMLCSIMVQVSLYLRMTRSKAVTSLQAAAELEKARTKIWGCLTDHGYPGGTCNPDTAQQHCVPANVSADFTGAVPNCHIALSLDI